MSPVPRHHHFIAGRDHAGADGRAIELVDPVDERLVGLADTGSAADIDTAVRAAREQLDGGAWSRLSGEQRGLLIHRLADRVERDTELIADLDAQAIGRMPFEPRTLDVPNAVSTLRTSAGWADKLEGRTIPTSGYFGQATFAYTRLEPVGVVGAIVPWNTPFMITCWKLGPLLAAGCTVVVKPAEETPLSALHLARLAKEAGFPDGVINVVMGRGAEAGHALAAHPGVDKISFTGSPEVGREIQRTAGPLLKRIALELGGKSPQIVFDDADFGAAVKGCAMGIFINQGQVCVAGSRVLVQRSIAEAFAQALAGAASSVQVGDPKQPGVQMGPLAKRGQLERVNGYIRKGLDGGARLLAGGVSAPERGFFVKPTIFLADNTQTIAREEIFGPVAVVIPFDSDDEAVRLANDTSYGLAATVWTNSVARAHKVAHAVKAGAIGVNCWAPQDPHLPFGGMKGSGIGRECGLSGVLAYTEEKVISVLLP